MQFCRVRPQIPDSFMKVEVFNSQPLCPHFRGEMKHLQAHRLHFVTGANFFAAIPQHTQQNPSSLAQSVAILSAGLEKYGEHLSRATSKIVTYKEQKAQLTD